MSQMSRQPGKLILTRRITLYSMLALVILYLVTGVFAATINWTTTLVPCATLLIFLPGMLVHHPRSYDWLCFVILLHFTVGVSNSMSLQSAWHDYLQTALSVVIFVGAMMSSRWLKAHINSENSLSDY